MMHQIGTTLTYFEKRISIIGVQSYYLLLKKYFIVTPKKIILIP